MSIAFISYQSSDRLVARKIQHLLEQVGCAGFLAHEDITVSEEWRIRLLTELGRCDSFIAILSASYIKSHWCIQEAGIAAFRQRLAIIPLSLDGTVPPAFLSHIQCVRVDPANLDVAVVFPALAQANFDLAAEVMIRHVAGAKSFRGAEVCFKDVLPFVDRFSNDQGRKLLEASIDNDQVLYATLCIKSYIPRAYEKFGAFLDDSRKLIYAETVARNSA